MKNTNTTTRTMILVIAAILTAVLFGAATVNADTDEAKEILNKIENHEEKIEVSFHEDKATQASIEDKTSDMIHEAIAEGDDYIKYGVYGGYKSSFTAKGNKKNGYDVKVTYTINYKTTKAQEKAFENKLDKTVKSLKLNGKSNKAKVKKIYNWITKNVKYDKKSKGETKYTAYAALNKKKAVCQGYSVLFYRMCEKAEVDAKVITGTSRGENHAWNIVKVGKKYYNADSTWDAGKSQKNYKYFLKGNKNFKNHTRSNEYSSTTFYNAFPMASK